MPRDFPNRKQTFRALAVCLLGAFLAFWAGCGDTPQERYRVLSFFFDGVPDPDKPVASTQPGAQASTDPNSSAFRKPVYTHKPYAEQKCESCHDNSNSPVPVAINEQVCLKCHSARLTEFPVMHGPVAVGACLWCHDPHESQFKSLLKAAPPKLCLRCHERPSLPENPPDHRDKSRNCLDCHMGHGGQKHGMIRDVIVTTQPTTQPETQPATQPTTQPETQPATQPTTQPQFMPGAVVLDDKALRTSLAIEKRKEQP